MGELECSSFCSSEQWRCWRSATLARLSSSALGLDLFSVWLVGLTSCLKSLQVKLARNPRPRVATSRPLDIMKFIVTIGWSIYPLGYFFGYLQSGVDDSTLNLVYNLADFVNKIAFCLAIWNCAKKDTAERA